MTGMAVSTRLAIVDLSEEVDAKLQKRKYIQSLLARESRQGNRSEQQLRGGDETKEGSRDY